MDSVQNFPDKIIDFHVHLFPDKLFDAIWEYFASTYGFNILHELHYQECVDYLSKQGVEYIVYSNYAHKKGIAKDLNTWNLNVLDEYPELYCSVSYTHLTLPTN